MGLWEIMSVSQSRHACKHACPNVYLDFGRIYFKGELNIVKYATCSDFYLLVFPDGTDVQFICGDTAEGLSELQVSRFRLAELLTHTHISAVIVCREDERKWGGRESDRRSKGLNAKQ